jgi:hypothetical protein
MEMTGCCGHPPFSCTGFPFSVLLSEDAIAIAMENCKLTVDSMDTPALLSSVQAAEVFLALCFPPSTPSTTPRI